MASRGREPFGPYHEPNKLHAEYAQTDDAACDLTGEPGRASFCRVLTRVGLGMRSKAMGGAHLERRQIQLERELAA